MPPGAPARQLAEARAVLREVRRTINEFRDGRWDGLVRSRNRLLTTVIFTGLMAYVLFALAVVLSAPPESVVAAAAFYLVGAIAGLFSRLRSDATREAAIEDYGHSTAQLVHAPLFSGLAAIGGVGLIALLPALVPPPAATPAATPTVTPTTTTVVGAPGAVATATPTVTPTPTATPPANAAAPLRTQTTLAAPPLKDIYNLDQNPAGLLIAAIFGLTPALLIDQLGRQAERYKADLRSSESSSQDQERSR
jgi:hypothetical protein